MRPAPMVPPMINPNKNMSILHFVLLYILLAYVAGLVINYEWIHINNNDIMCIVVF